MRVHERIVVAGMLACMACSAVTAQSHADPLAPPLESVLVRHVDGNITLDPTGAVAEFQTTAALSQELREKLDRVVLQWKFRPVRIGGEAQAVKAAIRVVLAATPVGEDYQVRIDNVVFPGDPDTGFRPEDGSPAAIAPARMSPPSYPPGLLKAGVSGMVLLGIQVGADGKTAQVVAVQSMLYDLKGPDKPLLEAIELMERSAIRGAQRWSFKISPERGALPAKDRTVTVPVEYRVGRQPDAVNGKWRTVVRIPKREMDWMPRSGGPPVGVADAVAGEVISADPRLKLESAAAGTVVL